MIVADWICTMIASAFMFIAAKVSKLLKRLMRQGDDNKCVFVYANDLLGDTAIKMPFFASLRREFPRNEYRIVAVLSIAMAGMLRKTELFDEVIEEDSLHWRHPIFWIFRRGGWARSLKWAFYHTADVFIVCHRSRSLGCDFAMVLSEPKISVAYATDIQTPMLPATARYQVKHFDKRYTHLLVAKDGRHQMLDMDRLISLATGREVKSIKPEMRLIAKMLDFSTADFYMKSGYVVFVPGARVGYRRWPIERFIELARRLCETVIVVGNANEAPLAKAIESAGCCTVINLCGRTTLAQLGGVLARAKYVVSNETGTASYSAMLGSKTVCILGGGDFGAFFPNPYCSNAISVFHHDECFNCGWNCKKMGPLDSAMAPCIETITVDDVYGAIQKIV